jgi:hypothetical protein
MSNLQKILETDLVGAKVWIYESVSDSTDKYTIKGTIRAVYLDEDGEIKYIVCLDSTGELKELYSGSFRVRAMSRDFSAE